MRAGLSVLFVAAILSACSPQPAPKQPLPKDVATMTLSEATALYNECTRSGSGYVAGADPRVPYSVEDCIRLSKRMDQLSLEEAGKYKGKGVGQPMLH